MKNLLQPQNKNIKNEDIRRPFPEILHNSIDFQNYSKVYTLCSEVSYPFSDFFTFNPRFGIKV